MPAEGAAELSEPAGKRVSWVELYFDLIFVFAVSQTTRIMVTSPNWGGFGRALGLFVPLWWTWIGFVVLCNRHYEDQVSQRLFILAGTLPCAVAAVETHSAAAGHLAAFAFALAAARLVLALAFELTARQARPVAVGYGVSAAVFAASVFVPSPGRYVLWGLTLIQEAGFLLLRNGELPREGGQAGRGRGRRGRKRAAASSGAAAPGAGPAEGVPSEAARPARPSRADQLRAMLNPPDDPARRVDAGHLAERFGAMIIILLGEVVVAVAGSAVEIPAHDLRYWTGLLSGLVLAAVLWWIYFTAAAPISEAVLRASGGNPSLAYGLYAGGHLSPAFAVLTLAAGVSLSLTGHASQTAAWLITGGLAAYLLGSRVVFTDQWLRLDTLLRLAVAAVTVCLALLEPLISSAGVVLVAAVWAAVIAAWVTWRLPGRLQGITADPFSYFRGAQDSGRPPSM